MRREGNEVTVVVMNSSGQRPRDQKCLVACDIALRLNSLMLSFPGATTGRSGRSLVPLM